MFEILGKSKLSIPWSGMSGFSQFLKSISATLNSVVCCWYCALKKWIKSGSSQCLIHPSLVGCNHQGVVQSAQIEVLIC
jgi:hypothetical protein